MALLGALPAVLATLHTAGTPLLLLIPALLMLLATLLVLLRALLVLLTALLMLPAAFLASAFLMEGLRGLPFLGFFGCSMYLLSHLIELL